MIQIVVAPAAAVAVGGHAQWTRQEGKRQRLILKCLHANKTKAKIAKYIFVLALNRKAF